MKQMIRTLSVSLFAITLFSACRSEAQHAEQTSIASDALVKSISAQEAYTMTRSGTLMVDVREEDETAETKYDVPNLRQIPLSVLESKMGLIPKDEPVIVACRSGNRSQQAIDILSRSGYTNLLNMDGGMLAWQEASYPYYQGINTADNIKSSSKACCANPNSKNCNPDGTCKTPLTSDQNGKACCADPKSKNCNPDGTCKTPAKADGKACCSKK